METKTAFEILQEKLTIDDTVNFRTMHLPEILTAMETYANQQLSKERADKEALGEILKEHLAEIESSIKLLNGYEGNEAMYSLSKLNVGYEDKADQIKSALESAGINL